MNRPLAFIVALLCATGVGASDIDLFVTSPSNSNGVPPPSILFVIDNTANWNPTLFTDAAGNAISKKSAIHQALFALMTDPANKDKLRMGVETFASHSGGKIIAAVNLLTSGYQESLRNKVYYNSAPWSAGASLAVGRNVFPVAWNDHFYQVTTAGVTGASEPPWPTNGGNVTSGSVVLKDMGVVYGANLGSGGNRIPVEQIPSYNNAQYALAFFEAYRYFAGLAPVYGLDTSAPSYDPAALLAGGLYNSPAWPLNCAKNYIVFIGNGSPDSGENTAAQNLLNQMHGVLTGDPIPLSPSNYQSSWADEFARHLNHFADVVPDTIQGGQQNVITYVIDVYNPASENQTNPQKAAHALLQSMARQGGGQYFTAANANDVSVALKKILKEVLAVNSVFASTTLPVSVNVRGTNLNQVYMGVFRPDGDYRPDWYGNLKMYQLAYNAATKQVYLSDSLGQAATSNVTGFIVPNAVSFWTSDTNSYSGANAPYDWSFAYPDAATESPDGGIVEKGGAGQHLRDLPDHTYRRLYTCTGSCVGAMQGFTTANGNLTDTVLGTNSSSPSATQPAASALINFVRGQNHVARTDGSGAIRSMVHMDVLHSRPAVINYGPSDDDVVVYYGANDGVFHAVKGGAAPSQHAASASGYAVAGEELWGFIPQEQLGQLVKLYNNETMTTTADKPYFVDGTIGSLDWNGRHYLYLTMRRGGSQVYALEVNDLPAGTAPVVAWRKTQADLPELGQTWSDPTLTILNIHGTQTPVLIMGAGYDAATEDADITSNASDTIGRGVYVLNAITGAKIQFLGNTQFESGVTPLFSTVVDSIPSAVTVVGTTYPTNPNLVIGSAAYVGDTGGNVWKLDLSNVDPAHWRMEKLAALGGGTGADNRKFLYQPDAVMLGNHVAVVIGSGDREHPLDTTVRNYFFMLEDTSNANTGPFLNTWPITFGQLYNATNAPGTPPSGDLGWYVELTGSGEKDVGSAITLANVVYFNTHVPGDTLSNTCSPQLGIARQYAISLSDASSQTGSTVPYVTVPGGGFLPSPVPFTVQLTYTDPTTGRAITQTHVGTLSGTQVGGGATPRLYKRSHQFRYKNGVD